MDDIRWFAPNRFCTLVVPRLRERGLTIALEGGRPARLAMALDAQVAAAVYGSAGSTRCPLMHYVWDLPPWRLGGGRADWVWYAFGCSRRAPRLGRRYAERRGSYSRVRFVATHARPVWVRSALTAASVQEHFGVACQEVPFCFDSDRFTPARAPRSRGLLSVSRLTAQKNHAAVVRAAARFEPKLAVRIVGSGPERDVLLALARALDVPCTIKSGLSEEDIVAAYRAADVVVCPSRFEGFGLTPVEATACAAPGVVSHIPSHRALRGTAPNFFTLDDDAAVVRAIAAARSSAPLSPAVLDGLTIEAAADPFFSALPPYLGPRPSPAPS